MLAYPCARRRSSSGLGLIRAEILELAESSLYGSQCADGCLHDTNISSGADDSYANHLNSLDLTGE